MTSQEILKKLSYDAAQETCQMVDFDAEVQERLKDMDLLSSPKNALLLGTTPSEMKAWSIKFGGVPKGISLERFEKKEGHVGYLYQQDMHDLEFSSGTFDFVYGSQVLEHSPAPIVALIQINRVLKKDGGGFFWMPTDEGNRKAKYHYSCFPEYIWEDLFGKAGFKINNITKRGNSFGYDVQKI
jgi:SAM-dependent methyltransferase